MELAQLDYIGEAWVSRELIQVGSKESVGEFAFLFI
jgi:hypothetical protein